ncbi:IclR family transcriptional regulator [Bosea sp. 47.2.35]|uniref:IclR family transcriptional regulator n=1 Tax=Bosea sp. 47.2.35 TaxID=2969304 RepID=UPI0021501BA1|nr:IclR family transcriptional regulator [Bosea sp. 47.2.35]MCR4522218.1 IclR family transcriptional regulator [Bosea sp. 47.2.35]
MTTPPQKLVPALTSAIRILRYLNRTREPASVSQIAQALGINASTCFNILKTLAYERLLVFDSASKRYSLGLGLVELAHSVLDAGFVRHFHPRLEEIASRFGVTALLWQDAGQDRFVLVDKAEVNAAIRVHLTIGQRFPILIGASGRCVAALSGIGKEELRERFKELRWQNAPDFESYWQDVQTARETGYAVDYGNFNTGITTVSAAVPGRNGIARMAISTVVVSTQFDEDNLKALAVAVKAAAQDLVAMTGGEVPVA